MKKIILSESTARHMNHQRTILSRDDFVLLTAGNTTEMLRLHGEEGADLIIVELDLPDLGGDGLSTIIRETPGLKNVSILLIHPDTPQGLDRAGKSGANSCIPLPLDPDIVSNRIQELLEIKARESMRVLMKVSVEGKYNNDYFFSHSQNISGTGILLESDIPLKTGDRITCSFFLQGEQLAAQGTITRVIVVSKNLYQYGVQFIDLDRQVLDRIEAFVQERHTNGGPE